MGDRIMWLTIAWVLFCISVLVNVYVIIVLRGALQTSIIDPDFEPHAVTGREREEIRRKLVNVGPRAVSSDDVLNLLYTFRQVELGSYKDDDVYVPDDPYTDVK